MKCNKCKKTIPNDDEVWIDPTTGQATMEGEPYHIQCAPNQY